MQDYVKMNVTDERIYVMFNNEDDKPFAVGEKMYAANEDAYMNGYNWEALFRYYLEQNDPDILTDMKTDPEAGMYVAYWPLTVENEARAKRFEDIIRALAENEEALCRLVREHGSEIEWD